MVLLSLLKTETLICELDDQIMAICGNEAFA